MSANINQAQITCTTEYWSDNFLPEARSKIGNDAVISSAQLKFSSASFNMTAKYSSIFDRADFKCGWPTKNPEGRKRGIFSKLSNECGRLRSGKSFLMILSFLCSNHCISSVVLSEWECMWSGESRG